MLAVRRAKLRVVRGPDAGLELELGDRTSATIGTSTEADLVLTDDSVSNLHAEVRAEPEGFVVRDLGSTNGTRVGDVGVREVVLSGKAPQLTVGETVLELRLARDEVQHVLSPRAAFGQVLGQSPLMRRVFAQLELAAPTASTVLLEGPSGSGKEIIASALHDASPRAAGAFVAVDCGAIPRGTIESELFGHRKGAFTGAVTDREGLIAEASGGTLFLDEIAELPLDLQPKLLRVLEQRQITPLGDTRPRDVDIRVIAASHQDLARCVERRTFRKDLYFRLAVVKIAVPPLRQRREDIPLLARALAQQIRPDVDPDRVLEPQVIAAMAHHDWPGNVRELRNVVERLLAVGELATALRGPARVPLGSYAQARRDAIDRFERAYCDEIMHASGGVIVEAARRAGLSRQMWHRLLKKHGIVMS
jgi:DNA-binding NtrC family response regulator